MLESRSTDSDDAAAGPEPGVGSSKRSGVVHEGLLAISRMSQQKLNGMRLVTVLH
jgi:hypothetical protein